jgi:tRNA pseudouridine(38-40) synthase
VYLGGLKNPEQPSGDVPVTTLCPQTDLLFAKDRLLVLESPLDWEAMRAAAPHIVGTRDFTAVRAAGCQAKSPYTTVREVTVERDPCPPGFFVGTFWPSSSSSSAANHPVCHYEFVTIRVRARSFLYRMVRNLVGIFLEVKFDLLTSVMYATLFSLYHK